VFKTTSKDSTLWFKYKQF